MTNEQLAVLLKGLQTQLRDAIEVAEGNMPADAEREIEWWRKSTNQRWPGFRAEYDKGDAEERLTGDFVALKPLRKLLWQVANMIERLK